MVLQYELGWQGVEEVVMNILNQGSLNEYIESRKFEMSLCV